MRPTHRVLAVARDRALAGVEQQLRRSSRALVTYEKELQDASTWPYNPAILRTLVVSILVPTVTLLDRRIFEVYIR